MTEQPERPKHLDLRASDADRERVARVLHDAMGEGRLTIDELDERLQSVYAAKTLGELVPLTADLPVHPNQTLQIPDQPAPPNTRIGGTVGSTAAVAVMSGFERTGVWTVPKLYTALAFMGGGELDLTEATFADRECTIQVFAFMGGVEVIVPEDVTVRVTGFGVMGGFDHRGSHPGTPGGPVLTVSGVTFMGGVEVRPPKRKNRKKQLEG